ncbi:hypothetical protein EJ02DRAFT_460130, partial [Clathrospora elynae]
MTSFRFPPPPPPPPKAAPSEQPYASQRGGHTRGGGERGRGRGGGGQVRGGGFHSSDGNTRGGYSQNNGRGDARGRGGQRGGQRGGLDNNRGRGQQRGGSNAGYGQVQMNARPLAPPTPPANAYANPPFMGQPPALAPMQQPVDPNAFAQLMSFMSTPAGVQSMAAFASHMTSTGNTAPPYPPPLPYQQAQSSPLYAPPQHAGQKRTLDDRDSNEQPQPDALQGSSKPQRVFVDVSPPVPGFGFSLPRPPAVKPLKKRKANLGLTQPPPRVESSDEEEMDEEAAYSQKLKGGGFAFEHEGETIAIRTAGEVAAWIKDRRKKFPTRQRIMEKAGEAANKRMDELDFLRRLKGKPPMPRNEDRQDQPLRARDTSKEGQMKQQEPAKARDTSKEDRIKQEAERRRQEELAALRKKLHESMMKKHAAPAAVDLGLGYDSETESDEESTVLSESSAVSSSEESSDSEPDDSDAAPEPTSSKVAPPPIRVPPPPRPAPPQLVKKSEKTCHIWRRTGRCGYGNTCTYAHPPKGKNQEKDKEVKHVSLYERMVEQELV